MKWQWGFFQAREFLIGVQRSSFSIRVAVWLSVLNLTIDIPCRGYALPRIWSVHWCEGKLVFTLGLDPYTWSLDDPKWRRFHIRLWPRRH